MTKLLDEIVISVAGSRKVLKFSDTSDLRRWAESELIPYKEIDGSKIANQSLRNIWSQQTNFFSHVQNLAAQFDKQVEAGQEGEAKRANDSIQNDFSNVSSGHYLISDHELYPAIFDLAKVSPDLGAIMLAACRNDSLNTLGKLGQVQIGTHQLIKLAAHAARSKGSRDWLQPQRKELEALRDKAQAALDDIREALNNQNSAISGQRENESTEHQLRIDQWQGIKDNIASDWEKLKKVYDEQLALLAPSQYWDGRAQSHKLIAIGFAIAFGVLLSIAVGVFAWLAMPHLLEVAGNREISPILTLIPVAVPAFASIWVLKMLSRLLSENLQMMRDARERETMVKTFLALMRDDATGKTLIKDDDRILILHSLFRPSSVTAADDAPPVHWFDLLTNKIGSSKGGSKS